MRGDDPRVPRGGQSEAGDLHDTASGAGDDHQFVAGDPAPHLRRLVPVRGRVPNVSPADGLVEADEALLTEGKQMRILGQHVQPAEFGGQPLGRGGPDGAMRAGVDLLAPPLTCVDELGETRYSPRRFASVGTRSAFAILTVCSAPPFDSGSNGSHVCTTQP
ncbi:hypothetical protein [Rhodococcus jostii]